MNEFTLNYAIVPNDNGTSSIVFFVPYQPLERQSSKSVNIDAYYKSSNTTYHMTKRIALKLQEAGINAHIDNHVDYKQLAIDAGLASRVKTTLVATKEYGTKIVLGVIIVDGHYTLLVKNNQPNSICKDCNLCVEACPTGALDSGFKRERCIRQLQDDLAICDDELAEFMGNRVLGCDECQRVCPYNREIDYLSIDREFSELIDCDKIIRLAYDGKKSLEPLESYIGKNYIRPKRLLSLALNAACNMDDYRSIDIAKQLIDSDNENVRVNAQRLLNKYNSRHY